MFASVAVTVRFTSDDIDYGATTGTNQTLKFDHVITNIGEGYDFLTGIFTAPFAGVYVFYLTAMSTNAIGEIVLAIEKNDTVLGMVFATGSSDQGSNLLTTELDTGECVWVRQQYGDAVRGETWTAFTGFLILMY